MRTLTHIKNKLYTDVSSLRSVGGRDKYGNSKKKIILKAQFYTEL